MIVRGIGMHGLEEQTLLRIDGWYWVMRNISLDHELSSGLLETAF